MKIKVFRKNDSQEFTGVTGFTIEKRGWLLSHVYVDMKFGEGASTHYKSKEHDISWKIDHNQSPGVGMDYCKHIVVQSSNMENEK